MGSASSRGCWLLALIAWQAIRLANIDVEVGVTPAMITAVLAVLTFVFVLIRFIDKPGRDQCRTSSTARSGHG